MVIKRCEHGFCGLCLTNHLRGNSDPACPTFNQPVPPTADSIRPGILLNRMFQSAYVKCSCGVQIQVKVSQEHQCQHTKIITTGDILNMRPSKPVPIDVDECINHIVGIKMKQSLLPNHTIQLPTGSSRVQ